MHTVCTVHLYNLYVMQMWKHDIILKKSHENVRLTFFLSCKSLSFVSCHCLNWSKHAYIWGQSTSHLWAIQRRQRTDWTQSSIRFACQIVRHQVQQKACNSILIEYMGGRFIRFSRKEMIATVMTENSEAALCRSCQVVVIIRTFYRNTQKLIRTK